MIQVIERVEKILGYLSENKDREVPLTEIADGLGINRGTCVNILKSLKELGLVEQADYRKGYVLGGRLYALAGRKSDSAGMVRLLRPGIDALCAEMNENVMLAVIRNDKRILLYDAKAVGHQIEAKLIPDMKAWQATTARVIIARYGKEKLDHFLKLAGLPGEDWPEASDRAQLLARLEEYRSRDCVTVLNEHFACIAAPVFKKGEAVASLGFYLPDIRLTEKSRKLLENGLVEASRATSRLLDEETE